MVFSDSRRQCFRILFPSYESPQTPCFYHYVRHYAGLRPVYIRIILAMDKTPYYDIDRNGKSFGHSVFTLYDGRVYAAVPSDGYFLIPVRTWTVSDYCLTITTTMAGNLQPINITPGAVIFPSRILILRRRLLSGMAILRMVKIRFSVPLIRG